MKRLTLVTVLTLASSPPLAAQDVATELYADFRYSYNRADAGDSAGWAGANNASRLGLRAEVTGRGLTVFADLQAGMNVGAEEGGGAFTQRYYLAGVRGGFGTATLGRHSTAYKMAGLQIDPFYDTSTLSAAGGVPSTGLFAGASFGLSNLTNGWADRALTYTSPSLRGFTGNAAVYVDTDSDHAYGLGLRYQNRGLQGGLQYYSAGEGRTWPQAAGIDDALRGHLSYRGGRWSVGVSYEHLEVESGEAQELFFAAGTVEATPALTLAAGVGHVGEGVAQPVEGTGLHTGVFYALLPQAQVHAVYSWLDPRPGPDRGNLSLGLTYHFVLVPRP